MKPRISVVVPFRNGMSGLPALYDGLVRQTIGPDAFEVIWVDDGSTDEGAGWLGDRSRNGWRLVRHPRSRGSYAARNTGVRAAASDNLAFIDVDCWPQPEWLAHGLEALARTSRVAGRIEFVLSKAPTLAELVDSNRFFRQEQYVQEGFAATANLFVTRDVFRIAGEFDERLRYGGDYEFGRRCTAAGVPISYNADAVVSHPARDTLIEVLRKGERVGYGAGQVMRLGRSPLQVLVRRAADRLSLAAGRNPRTSVAGREKSADGRRPASVTAVLCLIMVATAFGSIRGLLASVPEVSSE
ncbi:MAG: glycosyltransferase family 2 protein [Vicinamibacterales bacterium]